MEKVVKMPRRKNLVISCQKIRLVTENEDLKAEIQKLKDANEIASIRTSSHHSKMLKDGRAKIHSIFLLLNDDNMIGEH